jgi:hypothetical protein
MDLWEYSICWNKKLQSDELIIQQTCVEVAKALHTHITPFSEIDLA